MDLRNLRDVLRDAPELVQLDWEERQDHDDESDVGYYRIWWRIPKDEEDTDV